MESAPLSPLSSPADITQPWLEQMLQQKLGSSLKLNSWSMKLPEIKSGNLSEVCFLHTCFSISEGAGEEKRSLVGKFMPDAKKEILDTMKVCQAAEREVKFYEHASSKEFRVFCDNSGLPRPVPEVYWAGLENNKITIVLHDLYSDGLRLSRPLEGISVKQIKCALATVAVIHGSGIATIKKHGRHPGAIPFDMFLFKDYLVEGINKQITMFEGTPTANTLKALLPLSSELISLKEKYPLVDTIVHGDLWAANIMFSEDDQQACIFDWQFARVGNVVCDILHLLLMSGEVSSYTDHLTEILKCYWESLEQSLRKNGVSVDISFQDLVCNVECMWMYGYMIYCVSLTAMQTHMTQDRAEGIVHFLEKKGVFERFLKEAMEKDS